MPITIPASEGAPTDGGATNPVAAAYCRIVDMRGVTMESVHVLVVEDEPLLHDLLQDALESGGFSVTLVLTGTEAITALEAPDAPWSALVTDIRLGRDQPTGWDVGRRARELNAAVTVVYMTGDSSADWAANGVPNSLVLSKPFAPAQVVTAVAQLLNTENPPKV